MSGRTRGQQRVKQSSPSKECSQRTATGEDNSSRESKAGKIPWDAKIFEETIATASAIQTTVRSPRKRKMLSDTRKKLGENNQKSSCVSALCSSNRWVGGDQAVVEYCSLIPCHGSFSGSDKFPTTQLAKKVEFIVQNTPPMARKSPSQWIIDAQRRLGSRDWCVRWS